MGVVQQGGGDRARSRADAVGVAVGTDDHDGGFAGRLQQRVHPAGVACAELHLDLGIALPQPGNRTARYSLFGRYSHDGIVPPLIRGNQGRWYGRRASRGRGVQHTQPDSAARRLREGGCRGIRVGVTFHAEQHLTAAG